MPNDNIGIIPCALCRAPSPIRKCKTKSGTLYYMCAACGLIKPNMSKGQNYILENGKFYGPEGEPETEPQVPVQPVPDSSSAADEKPKRFWDFEL